MRDGNETVPILDVLRWQQSHVLERGSTVAGLVLEAVINDLEAGGPLTPAFTATGRFADLPGLRTMAAVHRLALQRQAPAVALHLPTLGGTPPVGQPAADLFMAAVVDALTQHVDVLVDCLSRAPQTNETGRAALLRCALSRLDLGLPVRLREIGASAGLNLRADHLPGDPLLEAGPLPEIVDRLGCDLHPIDPTTTEGRLTLSSYIWVDDVARFERLQTALRVAQKVPASVIRQDAATFVDDMDLAAGTTTVLWHSAFWLYLPEAVTGRILGAVDELGAQASPTRQFAHVSWEWSEDGLDDIADQALVLRRWRGGEADGARKVLARGYSHGGDARLVG